MVFHKGEREREEQKLKVTMGGGKFVDSFPKSVWVRVRARAWAYSGLGLFGLSGLILMKSSNSLICGFELRTIRAWVKLGLYRIGVGPI